MITSNRILKLRRLSRHFPLGSAVLILLLTIAVFGVPIRACAGSIDDSYGAVLNAADQDDYVRLESLLDGMPDIDCRDRSGYTLLMHASLTRNRGLMDSLLRRGADPNARDKEGYTALSILCGWSYDDFIPPDPVPSMAPQLLAAGADINSRNRMGITPLMRAVNWGHLTTVHFLLDHGANTKLTDRLGRTAFVQDPHVSATPAFVAQSPGQPPVAVGSSAVSTNAWRPGGRDLAFVDNGVLMTWDGTSSPGAIVPIPTPWDGSFISGFSAHAVFIGYDERTWRLPFGECLRCGDPSGHLDGHVIRVLP